MTGLCGVLGDPNHRIDSMAEDLRWTGHEETTTYADAEVALHSAVHPGRDRTQPARTPDGTLVWVSGQVWGCERADGYRPRCQSSETAAEFCAREYAERGIEFVAGLNGTFAGVVYDRNRREVHLITDRLGTHPVYYARPTPETVVFSTLIQSLPAHPAVDTEFDVEYLSEYFATGSVGGVKTPLTGIEELPPSSVTTVRLERGEIETDRYWRPRFDPLDRPFSYFVDEFVDRFERILDERFDPETRYGLLLSGGSDSRAILAGADPDVDIRTYHAKSWRSRETQITERVADVADRELHTLHRDRDTHRRLLDAVPRMMNFTGRFCEAHVHEFGDQLREEVDVLVSGLAADTLFRDHAFPVPSLRIGPLGSVDLPMAQRTESLEEFLKRRDAPLPAYLDTNQRLSDILRRNVTTEGGLSHHGVECRSVDELVFFDDFYPFSNKSDFFFHALNGMMPHWSPFFDNRLVDLALRIPLKHRSRRNLIDATTTELDERLGAIPHGNTGVPVEQSFPVEYVWRYANQFRWKFLTGDDTPAEHLSHGPWISTEGLTRSHEFVPERLRERADRIDSLPFLDRDGAWRSYQAHLEGADNSFELYTLLSFLEMPVVERVAGETRESARPVEGR
ncbi:asparagine synthase [Salinigranum rubrum]|uniref:Asparagine synthase n=1 Tax=Salinigranum rubrum TaxID=755307 RepID=A0A2I8VKX9_9EURY|nr:asparagine synthase-related protein [Salinigranum rubrum]AUV82571.1 asparagine synthase [Salinigranum rubrum]